MARSQTLVAQRNTSLGVDAKRPSAYDRFPSSTRNQWLDDLQAKIQNALEPPSSPGPSRSPSPLFLQRSSTSSTSDSDTASAPTAAAQELKELDELEDGSDEDVIASSDDQDGPLALPNEDDEVDEDGFDDEDDFGAVNEDAYSDHGQDDEDELASPEAGPSRRRPFPSTSHRQAINLEDEFEEEADGYEGLYDGLSDEGEPRLEDEIEYPGEESLLEISDGSDKQEESEVVGHDYTANTLGPAPGWETAADFAARTKGSLFDDFDQGEQVENEDDHDSDPQGQELDEGEESEQVEQAEGENADDVDLLAERAPGVGPAVGDTPFFSLEPHTPGPADILPHGLSSASQTATDSVYPPLPLASQPALPSDLAADDVRHFTAQESFASQLYPPLSSLPQPDIDGSSAAAVSTDMIDPSLLADFAGRVTAQELGSLEGMTASQNTQEMTALAQAALSGSHGMMDVPYVYHQPPPEQHGMGQQEAEGYEEDDESHDDIDVDTNHRDHADAAPVFEPYIPSGTVGDDEGGEELGEEDEKDSADEDDQSPRPNILSNETDPIEILSSDDAESADEQSESEDESSEEEEEEEVEETEEEETVEEQGIHAGRSGGQGSSRPSSPTEGEESAEPVATHVRFEEESETHLHSPITAAAAIEPSPTPSPIVKHAMLADDASDPPAADVRFPNTTKTQGVAPGTRMPQPSPFIETPGLGPANPFDLISGETAGSLIVEEIQITSTELIGAPDQEMAEAENDPEVEEPISRGPSVPLVTPAVELPSESAFVLTGDPDLDNIVVQALQQSAEPASRDLEDEMHPTSPQASDNDEIVDQAELDSPTFAPDLEDGPVKIEETVITIDETDAGAPSADLPDPMSAPPDTPYKTPIGPHDLEPHPQVTPSLSVQAPDVVDDEVTSLHAEEIVAITPTAEMDVSEKQDELVEDAPLDAESPAASAEPMPVHPGIARLESAIQAQEVEDVLDFEDDVPADGGMTASTEAIVAAIKAGSGDMLDGQEDQTTADLQTIDIQGPEPDSAAASSPAPATSMQREDNSLEQAALPAPDQPIPETNFASPLDVHRDLPLEGTVNNKAISLVVEPPSGPNTAPASVSDEEDGASIGEAGSTVDPVDTVGAAQISIEEADSPEKAVDNGADTGGIEESSQDREPVIQVADHSIEALAAEAHGPSSSDIDRPEASAPVREEDENTRNLPVPPPLEVPASPLRHHHGGIAASRQASAPPPASARATRSHTRRASAAPEGFEPPVTRGNCTYRKLWLVHDDMSATVLVPQCTLADAELLQAEYAEDRGSASTAEEASALAYPISEDTPLLQTGLTAKLHRIVGSGIFDEGKTYLLQANDAARLEVGNTSEAGPSKSSASPIKPRRSKRLSEAPSESPIKEEPADLAGSAGRTVSPVPEVEQADDESDTAGHDSGEPTTEEIGGDPNMSSTMDEDPATIADEHKAPEQAVTPTADHTHATSPDEPRPYNLRSKGTPEIPDEVDAATSNELTTPSRLTRATKTKLVTSSAERRNEDHGSQSQTTPMTTRRRARLSAAPTSQTEASPTPTPAELPTSPSRKAKGKRKAKETESNQPEIEETIEVVVPSDMRARRVDDDPKYILNEEDEKEDVDIDADDNDEAITDSSTDLIPHDQHNSRSSVSKKRKLRSSITSQGNSSAWKLDRQDVNKSDIDSDVDVDVDHSPSAGRRRGAKRRAVGKEAQPDTPVPKDVDEATETETEAVVDEEAKSKPQVSAKKSWGRWLWSFGSG